MTAQEGLLTVPELAERLRLSRSWVYDHADDLGAFRLGKYLRFSLPRVMERLESGAIGRSSVGPPTQRPLLTPSKEEGSSGRGTD
jgi:predicted DNA-binding transcriptional regulator AlpA